MKFYLNRFYFCCFFFIFYFLCQNWLGSSFLFLAYVCFLSFLKWVELFFLAPMQHLKNYDDDRISLNFSATKIVHPNFRKVFFYKKIFLLASFLTLSFISLNNVFVSSYYKVLNLFAIEHAYLRIEYPMFMDKKFDIIDLKSSPNRIILNTASYIEIHLENKSHSPKKATIEFILKQKNAADKNKSLIYDLNETDVWSSSVANLYDILSDKNEINNQKIVAVIIKDNEKKYQAELNIVPLPIPEIIFKKVNNYSKENSTQIFFQSIVKSTVPLSQISLQIWTKSNYHSSKVLADFNGNDQKYYKNDEINFSYLGIPFQNDDILFVKLIANTSVSNIFAESNILEFHIQTQSKIKFEIIQKVEKSLSKLLSAKSFNLNSKTKITDPIIDAVNLSNKISKHGSLHKNLQEIADLLNQIQQKHDNFYNKSIEDMNNLLKYLKKQQKTDLFSQFIYQVQVFKEKIFIEKDLKNSQQLIRNSHKLLKTGQTILKYINILVKNMDKTLLKEEKEELKTLLKNDSTLEDLNTVIFQIESKSLLEAQLAAQKSSDSATINLGKILQILQQAKQRSIQQAKKELQMASDSIEKYKYKNDKKEEKLLLQNSLSSLNMVPNINNDINKEVNVAKVETEIEKTFIDNKDINHSFKHALSAQNAIERALLSLEDEDQNDKEQQQEQDAKSLQSSMDVLSTQVQQDMGWRKKILEDISALKLKGESTDSPIIHYLESQLH